MNIRTSVRTIWKNIRRWALITVILIFVWFLKNSSELVGGF